ncbi:MAG TPA: GTP 3',8-cyclase MoaA [Candidatus Xenobia bacterium]|nr:GTP 3',8-cyclase MoaA [Candidatus Xenobia bacterium]
MLKDKLGREITDLRVSVTDRCNFRCIYCRSAEPENYQPPEHLLTWPELLRLCDILGRLGLRKIRVTGGEPLVRPGLEDFIARLAALGYYDDIAMTTNGYTLAERVHTLRAAGLQRLNISLDSLRPERFDAITRTRGALTRVQAGIDAAQRTPLAPVKVNVVVVRGFNDDEIVDFARAARREGWILRFIEFMPLDADHIWDRTRVVPAAEIRRTLEAAGLPLVPLPRNYASETAQRFRFADGTGEVGLVAPVSEPFCGKCSRIRLTADGKIRTCLFSEADHDLRGLVRGGASDAEVATEVEAIIQWKEEGHHINEPDFRPPSRTMVFIGG